MSLAEDHHLEEQHLPAGGRTALHGMVLLGGGPYFLAHIPMETPPHDFQIVAEVELFDEDGEAFTGNFSNSTFTFRPNQSFSLNDYVSGRLTQFNGSVHAGSFEMGGPVLIESILVDVKEFKLVRQIPSESDQEFIGVSDGSNSFLIRVITPENRVQQIQRVAIEDDLWCVKGPDFFQNCD